MCVGIHASVFLEIRTEMHIFYDLIANFFSPSPKKRAPYKPSPSQPNPHDDEGFFDNRVVKVCIELEGGREPCVVYCTTELVV